MWGVNPLGWLGGLTRKAYRAIVDAVGDIVGALQHFWSILDHLFHGVTDEWARLHRYIGPWVDAVKHGLTDTFDWLAHTVEHSIPDAISWSVRRAYDLAKQYAKDLARAAATALGTVRDAIMRAVHSVEHAATTFATWITRYVAEQKNKLDKAAHLVFWLLTSPTRLATWLVGAIIREQFRYLKSNARAFARWLFRHLLAVAMESLHLIENIVADLF